MSAVAGLLNKIYEITRGDLDSAVFPVPDVTDALRTSEFVRLARIERFWDDDSSGRALIESTSALVNSIHPTKCVFGIRCTEREVEYWVGRPGGPNAKEELSAAVRSCFSGSRVGANSSMSVTSAGLRHAVVLTGTPTLRTRQGKGGQADQIELLLRGLVGRRWLYLVSAERLRTPVVAQSINRIANEIRDVRATFGLRGSAIDENDRVLETYLQLLEAKLQRFESGRVSGMWNADVCIFSDEATTVNLAQGLLVAAFSGAQSVPDRIRAIPTSRDQSHALPAEPVTTEELATMVRPPHEEYLGYAVTDRIRYGVNVGVRPRSQHEILVGTIIERGCHTDSPMTVPADSLARHALVAGVTGSGKTTTCISLLRQAWKGGAGVPFLVVESAKSEYRALLGDPDFRGLRIFTVGDERTAPLRLNPFEVPAGVHVQTHIDYVKSLFLAAFVLYPPMPYVLEQSIYEIYTDRGWDIARNVNPRGSSPRAFPTLADLAQKIAAVVDRMGYDTRITMDVKAGLLARVNQLRMSGGKGLMFNTRTSVDEGTLFENPCVLELKSLVSDDEKAFLIGLILVRLYEHCERRGPAGNQLRHLTLIEEAHRLLRNTSMEQGVESANPRGRAIEVFANILSEIRAYGEGFIIAEQIPSKLTPDVVKNTGLKIVHRLVAEDDRSLLGATMNLDEDERRGLALSDAGEAVVFADTVTKAIQVRVPDATCARPLSAPEIAEVIAKSRLELARPCSTCASQGAARVSLPGTIPTVIVSAFRQLFNSIRLDASVAAESYAALVRAYSADRSVADSCFQCLVARLADDECDSRGRFQSWPFAKTDQCVERVISDVADIAQGIRVTSAAAIFGELHATVRSPWSGCAYCPRPCHFQFDTESLPSALSQEFERTFADLSQEWSAVAQVCWQAVADVVPADAPEVRRQAAFCFGAGRMHRIGIHQSKQVQLARQLARSLGVEVHDATG